MVLTFDKFYIIFVYNMKTDLTSEDLDKWGVYKIINLQNGDFYIGSTIESFKKRIFNKHVSSYFKWINKIDNYRSECPILYNAFKKYNIDNFKVEILFSFARKKDSHTNKKIATYLEKKFINKLNPTYNICKNPEQGGCPNLGRKLTEEWKKNIGKKAKLYKHKNNQEIYNKKINQNKELSSLYKLTNKNNNFEFIGSAKECAEIAGKNIWRWLKKEDVSRKGWKIETIKTQKKKIILFLENENKIFNSFGECDRFLNMYKGFTSTQVVNKKDKILNYKYQIVNKDIVWSHAKVWVNIKDGIEVLVKRSDEQKYLELCEEWCNLTQYTLEHDKYDWIIYSSINDYIAKTIEGKYKFKGDFVSDVELYKNPSKRIIPLALQQYFINGIKPEDFIPNHKDILDFCIRGKANSSTSLFLKYDNGESIDVGGLIRYYLTKNKTAPQLFKIGEGTKDNSIDSNQNAPNELGIQRVRLFNKIVDGPYNIDYEQYIYQTYKIIAKIEKNKKDLNYVDSILNKDQFKLF